MGALLALLAAVAYGAGDYSNGLASRYFASGPVTATAQAMGLIAAGAAVLLLTHTGPSESTLLWGALSGVGSGVGTFALYHGLSIGRMSLVATLSAVLTAVIPAIVGIASGDHLSLPAAAGILIAVPAIGLVSWQPGGGAAGDRPGLLFGALAGLGFALLFIALDQAGTRSGAWPLIPGQTVSLLLVTPFALHGLSAAGRPSPRAVRLMLAGGILSGSGNLLFLAATGHGELAIVAVLSALYPASRSCWRACSCPSAGACGRRSAWGARQLRSCLSACTERGQLGAMHRISPRRRPAL